MARAKKTGDPSPKKRTSKRENTDTNAEQKHRPRSFWRGYISFGLVNIPVSLHSAEKPQQEVHFKLLDKDNLAGIRYARISEKTGEEIAWHDIVKGYEYEPDNYAVLTDKDFESIAREKLKSIEIEDFIDISELSPLYFEKPYYLLPDKGADKGYVLLREVLKETKKVGIARIVIRTHQYLAAVIPYGSAIVVNTIRFPAELKKPEEMDLPQDSIAHYKISKKEFSIAEQLVEAMTLKWDPKRYINQYRSDLLKLIKAKVTSGEKKSTTQLEEPQIKKTNVIDFMELLKKSIKDKQLKKTNKKDTPTRTKKSHSKK